MTGICFEYENDSLIRDQWVLNLLAFDVEGFERNTAEDIIIRKEKLTPIKSITDIPSEYSIVVVTPKDARFTQGTTNLKDYQHKDNTVYYFGGDGSHLDDPILNDVAIDYIYIDINTHLWSSQAGTIVLYDIMNKK